MINADVLDAWFPPAPEVIQKLQEFSDWSHRISPPTYAEGLVEVVSNYYGCPEDEILVGAGSSALWFLFASVVLNETSKVLLVEPSYGEYAHVCRKVIGCQAETILTTPEAGFVLDLEQWINTLQREYFDLAVLINPNNPTGIGILKEAVLAAIERIPSHTKILIDEAYMDYWNPENSLLRGDLPTNVTVTSSFSKRFAMSGLRVAMIRTGSELRNILQKRTPPWAVSMPGQIAACAAFRNLDYYREQYIQTKQHRKFLKSGLEKLGLQVHDSCANWLLFEVPSADSLCQAAAAEELFIRNIGKTAPSLGDTWVRIAVKDEATNLEMLRRLKFLLDVPRS